jgi:hypothetical protein
MSLEQGPSSSATGGDGVGVPEDPMAGATYLKAWTLVVAGEDKFQEQKAGSIPAA